MRNAAAGPMTREPSTMKVYLDHNATTFVDPIVLEAMWPCMSDPYANPSSIHQQGQSARRAMDDARESLAASLGCRPEEIVFTSGGTESNNLAVIGAATANRAKGRHIVTTKIEHHCVLHACQWLEKYGFEVTRLPVDATGRVNPEEARAAIREDTILISVMFANNEVGSIQPVKEIARIAKERGILFHTDAVQGSGKVRLNVEDLGVDLLALAAHKMYGPKGIGLLYIRQGVKVTPLMLGGSQERNRRAGTSNVPGIVGMAKAMEVCMASFDDDNRRIRGLRDHLKERIETRIGRVHISADLDHCIANTLHVCFPYVESEAVLLNLDLKGIAVSAGSACTSGSLEASHVLTAMGLPRDIAQGGIRFSLGRRTTLEEIDYTVSVLEEVIPKLRTMSPQWNSRINA